MATAPDYRVDKYVTNILFQYFRSTIYGPTWRKQV